MGNDLTPNGLIRYCKVQTASLQCASSFLLAQTASYLYAHWHSHPQDRLEPGASPHMGSTLEDPPAVGMACDNVEIWADDLIKIGGSDKTSCRKLF